MLLEFDSRNFLGLIPRYRLNIFEKVKRSNSPPPWQFPQCAVMVAQEIHRLIHPKLKNQLHDRDAEVAPELGAKMGLGPACPPGQITERNSLRKMLFDLGANGKAASPAQ